MIQVKGYKDKVLIIEKDKELYNLCIRSGKNVNGSDDVIFSKDTLDVFKNQISDLLKCESDIELAPLECECGEELVRLSKIESWYFINIYTSHNRMKEKYHSISFDGKESFQKLEEEIEKL